MKTRRITTIALLTAAALGAFSCGLFKTRDPVQPNASAFPCFTLTTPVNVYTNILQAYGVRDGLSCYLSTVADSVSPTKPGFHFHPDPNDSTGNLAVAFAWWNKGIEERVAENIANDADSTYDLRFGPPEIITSQLDLEVRRYPYQIDFRGSAVAPDTFFQGLAEIRLERESGGEWQVTDWVDRRDPNGTTTRTWGYLRGSYRIGF